MLEIISFILPTMFKFVGGFFDDKPNIKKAIMIGASMAETGLEGWHRFATIAEKIRSMPEGQDFTDEDLDKMSATRDIVLDSFIKMLEARKASETFAPDLSDDVS